jgi:hypothetical protein
MEAQTYVFYFKNRTNARYQINSMKMTDVQTLFYFVRSLKRLELLLAVVRTKH